jgi:hypothetical protein
MGTNKKWSNKSGETFSQAEHNWYAKKMMTESSSNAVSVGASASYAGVGGSLAVKVENSDS